MIELYLLRNLWNSYDFLVFLAMHEKSTYKKEMSE